MSSASSYIGCHDCHLVHAFADTPIAGATCLRCGAVLHSRKTASLSRSWAYLIAAIVLYVPANVYPIMTVRQFGTGDPDTILTGAAKLLESGMWPLALLVFVASVVIPILKILIIGYLLMSVQFKSSANPITRTRLYSLVEFIGRWSMVDVFMVSILIALVRLGNFAVIDPGVGAMAFGAVVVLTMFASLSFDPRLIWDTHTDLDNG
ncbi:MAG: paraquat-inducible protein A [Gammaproteobacteria bacterium]